MPLNEGVKHQVKQTCDEKTADDFDCITSLAVQLMGGVTHHRLSTHTIGNTYYVMLNI